MARSAFDFDLPLRQPRRGQPLREWLYESIRDAIRTGLLQPGIRLPASREIAQQHKVARGTVVAALEQLAAEGYLRSRVGAGTFVTDAAAMHARLVSPGSALPEEREPLRLARRLESLYDADYPRESNAPLARAFRANQPALDRFPWDLWNRVASKVRVTLPARLMMDQHPFGYRPLREEIARHAGARRSLNVSVEQVIVFSGMQQAMGFVASVLADVGDGVMVEEPGYPGAGQAFAFAGLRVVRVPVDEYGFDVGAARTRERGVRMVHVTPAHQAPLGSTMTLDRRLELLRWASANGIWILEDDYDGEFRFDGRPLPALQSLDGNGRVLYAATFSKTLFSSLRLAYLIVPPELVAPFAAARWITDRFSPILEQAVLFRFLADGHFARHVHRMRKLYAERHEALRSICGHELGEFLKVEPAATGLQTPAYLTCHQDDVPVAAAALAAGIEVIPLSAFYAAEKPRAGLLMGFATVDAPAIVVAAQKLRRILERRPRETR